MSQDFPWTFLQNDKNNVKIIPISQSSENSGTLYGNYYQKNYS